MAYSKELEQLLKDSHNAYRAMKPNLRHAHATRVYAKPATESRLLHAMDSLENLELSGIGTLEMSSEVLFDGKPCVRMCPPSEITVPRLSVSDSKIYGDTHTLVKFDREDWRDYNRLTFEIYPDLPTYENVYFLITLVNDREEDLKRSGLLADTLILQLEHGKWNRVVWEIPSAHRDRMIGIQLRCTVDGRQAGSDLWKKFYFGPIHLEKVEEDYYEGWALQDRIAFCHVGYQPGSRKCAYTQDAAGGDFALLNAETHKVAFTAPCKAVSTPLGDYFEMDFSDFDTPGSYILRVGERETGAFRIDDDAYASPIWKAINFFYQERCGCEVEGVHRVCHRDTFARHPDGRLISSGGGWHDAGDLSQGLCNTSESAHAMLDLALSVKDTDPTLYERLLDEARWGLDWCLKTRFGDGYRARWTRIGIWTDNLLGTMDDLVLPAAYDPFENFCGAAAQAAGAKAFRERDPVFADYCLRCAKEDFNLALARIGDGKEVGIQTLGQGAVAAAELYKVCGDEEILKKGAWLARLVLECQQTDYPDWEVPMRGFFYENAGKARPLAYSHRAHEQSPVMGLALLAEAAPDHADAPKWVAGLELYAEYIKTIEPYTAPYGMLPNAIYRLGSHGKMNEIYDPQIKNGIRLSSEYYLRILPVAHDYRGYNGTLMTKTKAVTAAARVLGDSELYRIARRQVEWILGLNPFTQCTMYGEGYNYPDLFVMFSHQLVGGVPVGIWNDGDRDVPYFPHMNNATYKEVWVHSTSRFLWVLADLYGLDRKSGAQTLCGEQHSLAGDAPSEPCDIRASWKGVAWKTLNGFAHARCGCSVPGAHQPCHEDCFAVHPDGRKAEIGGGWHDGEGLSHDLFATATAVQGLMAMYQKTRDSDPELAFRLSREARRGLEWMLRTRFGDGFRCVDAPIAGWTNGVIGDGDDIELPAHNDPYANLCAASAQAIAARVYQSLDPTFAGHALRCAEQDFRFGYERLGLREPLYGMKEVTPKPQLYAKAVEAAAELFAATGKAKYLDTAARFARPICEGGEYAPERAIALARLLQAAPAHADAKLWQDILTRIGAELTPESDDIDSLLTAAKTASVIGRTLSDEALLARASELIERLLGNNPTALPGNIKISARLLWTLADLI